MIWDTLSSIAGCICRLLPVVEYESSYPPDTKGFSPSPTTIWKGFHLFSGRIPKDGEMEDEEEIFMMLIPNPDLRQTFVLLDGSWRADGLLEHPQGPEITGNEGGGSNRHSLLQCWPGCAQTPPGKNALVVKDLQGSDLLESRSS